MFNFRIMENYFKMADKSNDKKISFDEMNSFLRKLNLQLDKSELKKKLKVTKKAEICILKNLNEFI